MGKLILFLSDFQLIPSRDSNAWNFRIILCLVRNSYKIQFFSLVLSVVPLMSIACQDGQYFVNQIFIKQPLYMKQLGKYL